MAHQNLNQFQNRVQDLDLVREMLKYTKSGQKMIDQSHDHGQGHDLGRALDLDHVLGHVRDHVHVIV